MEDHLVTEIIRVDRPLRESNLFLTHAWGPIDESMLLQLSEILPLSKLKLLCLSLSLILLTV